MSVRRSLTLSFAEKYAVLLISIVSTMILARLLSPAEIGIFSVSVAVIGIAQMLRDFGVTQYLIVEEDLTRDRIRAAFGVTIAISWTLAAALFAARGAIADFYDEPGLSAALSVLSFNFLLIPFGNPVLSLLRRDMAFGALFWINTGTAVVRETTSVGLAFAGFGFMSLVWGSFASVATTALLATLYRPSQAWVLPGFREWRRVFRFGLPASGTALVTETGISAADLAIGRIQGFAEVGLYSRALGLVNLFHQNIMSAVRWVSLPAFAADSRAGQDVRGNYLKSVSYITAIAWPFYGFLALMAFPVIRILFGDQWDESVPLARILAAGGAVGALWALANQVLTATGHVNRVFRAECAIQACRIGLIVVAAFHSLAAVALAQVASYLIGFFVFQRYLSGGLGIGAFDVLAAAARSVVAAAAALAIPVVVVLVWGLRPDNAFLSVTVAGVGLAAGWLAGLAVSGHPMLAEIRAVAFRRRNTGGEA